MSTLDGLRAAIDIADRKFQSVTKNPLMPSDLNAALDALILSLRLITRELETMKGEKNAS